MTTFPTETRSVFQIQSLIPLQTPTPTIFKRQNIHESFLPQFSGGVDWRQKLDVQRGAVLANELKNNACKLAKWTVQALLAGSDLIKFG